MTTTGQGGGNAAREGAEPSSGAPALPHAQGQHNVIDWDTFTDEMLRKIQG